MRGNPVTRRKSATDPPPESVARCAWRWTRTALVIGMLVVLVVLAKPRRLAETLLSANGWWVLSATPWAFAAVFLDSLRLHLLMRPQGYRRGWWAVVRTNLVVNFVSLFLPGTIGGGAVAWYRLARPDGLHAQTFTALTLNILLKFIAVCAAGAAALALGAGGSARYHTLIAPLTACALAPLGALYLLLLTGAPGRINDWIGKRQRIPRKFRESLGKVLESVEVYRPASRHIAAALSASVARILVSAPAALFCLYAFGVENIGYVRLLWIMCAVEAAGMMPFTLSGWGLTQVTFVGLLAASGVPPDVALAANLAGWAALLPMLLTGAGVMLWENLHQPADPTGKSA